MEKRKSNYDITRDRVEGAFAGYDQEAMIRKFRLDSDEGFLYIRFAAREYRINRKTGRVERLPGLEHAGFNEVMTIFDVLCGSKEDCRLSGEFVRVNDLDGVTKTAYLGGNLLTAARRPLPGGAGSCGTPASGWAVRRERWGMYRIPFPCLTSFP